MSAEFPPRIQNQLICLIFLYVCKGNVNGNQANRRFRSEIPNLNRPISANFQRILKISTATNWKLCPLERRMPELSFFIWISGGTMPGLKASLFIVAAGYPAMFSVPLTMYYHGGSAHSVAHAPQRHSN